MRYRSELFDERDSAQSFIDRGGFREEGGGLGSPEMRRQETGHVASREGGATDDEIFARERSPRRSAVTTELHAAATYSWSS